MTNVTCGESYITQQYSLTMTILHYSSLENVSGTTNPFGSIKRMLEVHKSSMDARSR